MQLNLLQGRQLGTRERHRQPQDTSPSSAWMTSWKGTCERRRVSRGAHRAATIARHADRVSPILSGCEVND